VEWQFSDKRSKVKVTGRQKLHSSLAIMTTYGMDQVLAAQALIAN